MLMDSEFEDKIRMTQCHIKCILWSNLTAGGTQLNQVVLASAELPSLSCPVGVKPLALIKTLEEKPCENRCHICCRSTA